MPVCVVAITERRWILQRVAGRPWWFFAVLWASSFGQTACDVPAVTLVDPDIPVGEEGVTFVVQLEDTALAAALGWRNGVPNAEVYLHRMGDEFNPLVLQTDTAGEAHLSGHVSGRYRIAAYRRLDESEAGPANGVIRAFGDGGMVYVGKAGIDTLTLRADQAGSVVFSELYPVQNKYISMYQWFQYFELYNNSDTTVYLDGMLWGVLWRTCGGNQFYSCTDLEPFCNDPLGVWATFFHQFPGRDNEHGVAPGQTVVVALDAVDHSVVHPVFPDLSHADFELQGTADVDNPDVPNLRAVGKHSLDRGHGLEMMLDNIVFLALPVDVESLEERIDPFWGWRWARIPAHLILDVVTMQDNLIELRDQRYPPCGMRVHRSFDRLEGGFINTWEDSTVSLHRRILRTAPGGRVILQDVNTSFLDIIPGALSPGRIDP